MLIFCLPTQLFHKIWKLPNKLNNYSELCILSAINCHLPRTMPMSEQQRHLPSTSMEIEPGADIAVDLQQPLREYTVA